MRLSPGANLGPYQILSLIGIGGMGEVYKARDLRLERIVAIKLLHPELAERPDRRARFETEARAISRLNHPHVCTLFDVGHQDGAPFLVMEYLEGETLDDRLRREELPAGELLRYATEIADALAHAHGEHIVHRDVKPSNVMLTASGAKLFDFGLAKSPVTEVITSASTLSVEHQHLTAEGTLIGTFHYMAPEQLEGKAADSRSDIFAFGTVLYEMGTRRKAFDGANRATLIASILTGQPPSIASVRPASEGAAAWSALDHVVERCLAKNPDQRWQTARDVKLELEWIRYERNAPHTAGRRQAPGPSARGIGLDCCGRRARHDRCAGSGSGERSRAAPRHHPVHRCGTAGNEDRPRREPDANRHFTRWPSPGNGRIHRRRAVGNLGPLPRLRHR